MSAELDKGVPHRERHLNVNWRLVRPEVREERAEPLAFRPVVFVAVIVIVTHYRLRLCSRRARSRARSLKERPGWVATEPRPSCSIPSERSTFILALRAAKP
jgi:hypothetical protein